MDYIDELNYGDQPHSKSFQEFRHAIGNMDKDEAIHYLSAALCILEYELEGVDPSMQTKDSFYERSIKMSKDIHVPLRCYGADDNVCETIRANESCSGCGGCADGNNDFYIHCYDDFFTLEFVHKIGDLSIIRFSERIGYKDIKPE